MDGSTYIAIPLSASDLAHARRSARMLAISYASRLRWQYADIEDAAADLVEDFLRRWKYFDPSRGNVVFFIRLTMKHRLTEIVRKRVDELRYMRGSLDDEHDEFMVRTRAALTNSTCELTHRDPRDSSLRHQLLGDFYWNWNQLTQRQQKLILDALRVGEVQELWRTKTWSKATAHRVLRSLREFLVARGVHSP